MPGFRQPNAWTLFWTLAVAAFGLLLLDLGEVFGDERHIITHAAGLIAFAAAGAALLHALRLSRASTAADIAAGQELVADLMDSVPDGLALWTADGTLTTYNPAFLRRRTIPEWVGRGLNYRNFVANYVAKAGLTGEDAKAYIDRRMAAFAAVDGTPYEFTKLDGSIEEIRFYRARNGGVLGVYRDVTELKRRDAELQRQRAEFAEILETLPDGLMLWDSNGRLTAFNQAATRLRAGFQPMLVGTRFEDFVRAGLRSGKILYAIGREEKALAERLAEHADPKGIPREVERADGRWDEIRKFKTNNGGVVTIYRDITERKRGEAELELQRGRLADIMDAIPDGVVLWDGEYRLVAANAAAANFRPKDLILTPGIRYADYMRELAARNGIAVDASFAARISEHAAPSGTPLEFPRADGTWEEVRKFRARDGGVVTLFRDITERKRAIDELERQRRLLQEIMDALPDGLQVWGPDGKLVAFNRKADEQRADAVPLAVGIEFADFIRRCISAGSIPAAEGREDAFIVAQIANHADPIPQAREIQRADGRWEEMRKVATSDGGRLSLFRDITEAKAAQAEMKAQRDELARQLAERERLMAERDSAEAASRAKTEFLAMMSHELRTPMNGVIATTGLLARTRLADEQRLYLDTVQRSAQSLLTIIDDVLDWAKLEEGRIEIEPTDCAPAQIADNVVSLMRPAAAQKGIELALVVDPALPEFGRLDPARLRQILLNLIGNAVKFTAQGRVSVRLAAEPLDEGHLLLLEIEDTGIGIAPESLPKLFHRFSQADGSIARRFGGTGLGLAIVKRLLDLMGGSIEVNSRPGEGSRFAVRLPVAPGKRPEHVALPLLPATTRALNLLVAEDNAINRLVVAHLLRELGHSAEFAHDGAEAVTKARDGDHDAILMDVQMPDIDGIQATRLIRALDGPRARVPIVALTANAMVGDRERYLDAGMDDYVSKPIDAYELAAALARATGGPGPAPGTAPETAASPSHEAGRAALAGLVEALKRASVESD